MPEKPHDDVKELWGILDALARATFEASDVEIREELQSVGEDPECVAKQLRARLLSTTREHMQRKLREAREVYDRREADLRKASSTLAGTPAEWRERLAGLLGRDAKARELVTLQFRDFKNLSDEDLRSLILELQELGLLQKNHPLPG